MSSVKRGLLRAVAGMAGACLAATLVYTAPAHAATGATIVSVAQGELTNSSRNHEIPMDSNCNYYSGYWGTGSSGCTTAGFRSNAWCADFAHYVWATAGVATLSGINSWAYSFAKYGYANGTLHVAGSGYNPQPGDTVVFDWDSPYIDLSGIRNMSDATLEDIDHLGIVTSYSSGTVNTIEGNASDQIKANSYSATSVAIRAYISPSGIDSGGSGMGRPGVATDSTGQLEVFYRGTDGRLYMSWQGGGQWNGPVPGASNVAGSPVVGKNSDGRLEVFYRGTDGYLWHQWQGGGQWNGPLSMGYRASGDPAVGYESTGAIDLFFAGSDGHLNMVWQGGGQWNGPAVAGGATVAGTPTAVRNTSNLVEVFYRGTDGYLWHQWQGGGQWNGPLSMGYRASGDPTATNESTGEIDLFYLGADGQLKLAWQGGGQWNGG